MRLIDLTGREFGRWRVLRYDGGGRWLCRCACGTERAVRGQHLSSAGSESCGCAQRVEARCRWCGRNDAGGRAKSTCQACSRTAVRRGRYPCGKPRRQYVTVALPAEHVCAECQPWPRPKADAELRERDRARARYRRRRAAVAS